MFAKHSLLSTTVLATFIASAAVSAESVNQQDLIKELFKSSQKEPIQTLADAARKAKKLVGTALSEGILAAGEQAYLDIAIQEFDYLTPENSGKWGSLQSTPGMWDFSTLDQVADFAAINGQQLKGHTLVWHNQTPSFINDQLTAAELQDYIDQHITTTVSRYAGQFFGWDVVNEAIADDGSFRDSVFYQKLGTDYIADAFFATKSLDNKARRYYNDYNIAGIGPKSNAVYNLLQGLRNEGVPVNAIGFQMHLDAVNAPSYDNMVENFQRFADLGLYLAISELDVRIANLPWDHGTNLALQQQVYHNAVAACMQFKKCESVTTWGLTDKYSWIDSTLGPDDPLPFDEAYQRKPAFYGMVDAFAGIAPDTAGARPNLIANGQFEAGSAGWSGWDADVSRVITKNYKPKTENGVKFCPTQGKLGNAGKSALLISNRTANWNSAAYDITSIVRPGLSYDGQVFAKLINTTSDTVTLSAMVQCDGEDNSYFDLASVSASNLAWSDVSGRFTAPECEIASAALYIQGPAAEVDLLIDRVSLRPETLVPDTTGLGANIVANPGFEDGSDYWFGFGDALITASAEQANSGAQSGFVSGRTDTWQGPATSILGIAEPGTDYRIFASVRSAVENIQLNATLKASCPSGDQFNYITSVNATANGWSMLSGEFSIPDCELSDLTVYFEGPAAGVEFYIDDVNIRQVLSSVIPSANLVTNGDFENGTTGWTVWGGTLTTTTGYEGTGALHSDRTGTWQGPVYDLLAKVVAGEEYTISAWARVANSSAESMNITVKTVCDDGTEAFNWGGSATLSDTGWAPITGSVTLPDCTLTEVSLYFDGPAIEADILLDNVIVEGASIGDPNNLVSNPGFESGLNGWTAWAGTLAISSDAHSGTQSAVLTGRTDTWQGPVYNLLSAISADGAYAISGWGKVAGSATGTMNIVVKTSCDDGSEAYNFVGGATVSDSAWSEISGEFTAPSCNLTEASLYFEGPAAGIDSMLDDVSVIPLP